jgi:uncharacterized protein with NRDE domain
MALKPEPPRLGHLLSSIWSPRVCVLTFAWMLDPDRPLVLAGNRDERHDRPASPLERWAEDPRVLAGRDLTAGGTWLGVSERGVLATVTNLRGGGAAAQVEGRPSRGWLVRDILLGEGAYSVPAPAMIAGFNPMNLLVFTPERARFWSNWPELGAHDLAPGLYVLANETLDHPEPRTDRLKAGLLQWMDDGSRELEALLVLLSDPGAMGERGAFLQGPGYGTRCSTVVQIGADGAGEIRERRFGSDGACTGETLASFAWP